MASNVYSAVTAKISVDGTNAVATVANMNVRVVSDTPGGMGSRTDAVNAEFNVPGNKDATGSFEFYNKTVVAAITPGAAFTIIAHTGQEQITGTAIA
ncbi:MAG: hypothetical protein AAB368_17170, partial [bacterium]